LIDLLTIELKRGYNGFTMGNLLDESKAAAKRILEAWIGQACKSHRQAGSLSWLLVHRRDRRIGIVYMPVKLFRMLCVSGCLLETAVPSMTMSVRIKGKQHQIFCVRLSDFFRLVEPKDIKELVR
jgi:hypothetical protein